VKAAPTIIVVAAGRGARSGAAQHKLMRPHGSATVLDATLHAAVATGLQVVVVTTLALAETAQRHVAARDVVIWPGTELPADAGQGLGDAIAAGVGARPNAAAWLVLPGDLAGVRSASLSALAGALEQHPAVYAQHRGRRGQPMGFAGELYSELITLTGDEGVRRLLSRYPTLAMELDDPGVLAAPAGQGARADAADAAHPSPPLAATPSATPLG
jgi:molybdenum cofactor cytidylyltransferase